MAELGGLPKLPAICSQCGGSFSARACGPTHAVIWQSIEGPVRQARKVALSEAAKIAKGYAEGHDTATIIVRDIRALARRASPPEETNG